MPIAFFRVLMIGLIATSTIAAQAEDKQAARSQEQVRRMRQQLQQMQQNEQKMQQEKSAADEQLKQRSDELNVTGHKLKDSTRQLADLEVRFKALEQERDALNAKLGDTSKKLSDLEVLQRDTTTQLRTRDGEAQALQTSLTAELAERKRCEVNNIALYQYGRELMSLYENKGVIGALRDSEPVLGLGKVATQNMLEEYRDKLDAQRRQGFVNGNTVGAAAPVSAKP
jgi:chromosome segregation ATPase